MVRKLLPLFFLFLFCFSSFPFIAPAHAAGATCAIETDPSPVTTNDMYTNMKIKTTGLVDGKKYRVKLNGRTLTANVQRTIDYLQGIDYSLTNGELVVTDVDQYGDVNKSRHINPLKSNFLASSPYKVEVVEQGIGAPLTDKVFCEATFVVKDLNKPDCSISYTNTSFTSTDDISVKITGLDPTESFTTYVQRDQTDTSALTNVCHTGDEYTKGVSLGKFENGVYYIAVFRGCSIWTSIKSAIQKIDIPLWELHTTAKYCSSSFAVPGGGINTDYSGPTFGKFTAIGGTPPPSPCKNIATPENPTYVCKTAIGDINTNPTEFVKRIMGIFLGLAGGIAVILIIMAGYKILTSQGQPEKIQEARETITSTIIGLLFMIFAIVILQIIGVDILKIPGFTK